MPKPDIDAFRSISMHDPADNTAIYATFGSVLRKKEKRTLINISFHADKINEIPLDLKGVLLYTFS